MFCANRLLAIARQSCVLSNITNSFRALGVTPHLLQHKHSLVKRRVSDLTSTSTEKQNICEYVFDKVNRKLAAGEEGRLFAVVHLCGKQFKITPGDIILVEGYWPPTIGDEIRLDKVLLAGSRDFTLIGAPLLTPGLVTVNGTVIEKTLTHTKTHFKKKRRKQFMRINFQRSPNTMIRINAIEVNEKVDKLTSSYNHKSMF